MGGFIKLRNEYYEYYTEAIDEVVLALTLHDNDRVWKGVGRDVLNRLYERGFIGNPVNKAKPVVLTEEGLRQSRLLFQRYFTTEDSENDETDF